MHMECIIQMAMTYVYGGGGRDGAHVGTSGVPKCVDKDKYHKSY